jgi:hypothetical protein
MQTGQQLAAHSCTHPHTILAPGSGIRHTFSTPNPSSPDLHHPQTTLLPAEGCVTPFGALFTTPYPPATMFRQHPGTRLGHTFQRPVSHPDTSHHIQAAWIHPACSTHPPQQLQQMEVHVPQQWGGCFQATLRIDTKGRGSNGLCRVLLLLSSQRMESTLPLLTVLEPDHMHWVHVMLSHTRQTITWNSLRACDAQHQVALTQGIGCAAAAGPLAVIRQTQSWLFTRSHPAAAEPLAVGVEGPSPSPSHQAATPSCCCCNSFTNLCTSSTQTRRGSSAAHTCLASNSGVAHQRLLKQPGRCSCAPVAPVAPFPSTTQPDTPSWNQHLSPHHLKAPRVTGVTSTHTWASHKASVLPLPVTSVTRVTTRGPNRPRQRPQLALLKARQQHGTAQVWRAGQQEEQGTQRGYPASCVSESNLVLPSHTFPHTSFPEGVMLMCSIGPHKSRCQLQSSPRPTLPSCWPHVCWAGVNH